MSIKLELNQIIKGYIWKVIIHFNMTYKIKLSGLVMFLLLGINAGAQEAEQKYTWPLELTSKEGIVITLYQPQLESFTANILEGRMVVTIKPKDKDMIFGAVWFKATVSTDTENRTLLLEKMHMHFLQQ